MDKEKWLTLLSITCIIVLYYWLYHLVVSQSIDSDFPSLYASLRQLQQGLSPYTRLYGDFLNQPVYITVNLNPPSTLFFFYPLVFFTYTQAIALYTLLSIICLVTSAWLLCWKIYDIRSTTQKINLTLLSLVIFPAVINTAAAQMGAILLLLVVAGWYFDRQRNTLLCAIFWGMAIAVKLFPALLIFYCLIRRRFETCLWMIFTAGFILALPYALYGPNIYLSYFRVLDFLFWYDSNWNGSLLGFLSRLYGSAPDLRAHSNAIQVLSFGCLALGITAYLKLSARLKKENEHQHEWLFCFTIITMLLLSPLGWVYYYPLLTVVIIKIVHTLGQRENSLTDLLLWWLAFFFINIPLRPFVVDYHYSLITRLTLSSFYFYGLSLMLLLCYRLSKPTNANTLSTIETKQLVSYSIGSSLIFSIILYMTSIAMQSITERMVIS